MNILLLVVVAFLGISAFIGMKKGLIKTVFSMFSMIAALILTAIISPMIAKGLQENEKVMGYFSEKVCDVLMLEDLVGKAEGGVKEAQESFFDNLPLPDSIKNNLQENNNTDYYEMLGAGSFVEYVSNYIACMIIKALCFVGVFIAVSVLLWFLCISLDLISKLPVLNGANHFLGLAAGFVNALIIIWIFFVIVTAVSSTAFGQSMMTMISESPFLNYIYSHNLLLGKIAG